jgi:hypothetical protein
VTLVAWVNGYGGLDGLNRLVARFAAQCRSSGTVDLIGSAWESMPEPGMKSDAPNEPPGLRLTLRYRDTCRNRGNHDGDARRFCERALAVVGDDERGGYVSRSD